MPENKRQLPFRQFAVQHVQIRSAHGARRDAHEHLPRTRLRPTDIFEHELLSGSLGRAKDPAIARCALEHEAVLLTGDFGFADNSIAVSSWLAV